MSNLITDQHLNSLASTVKSKLNILTTAPTAKDGALSYEMIDGSPQLKLRKGTAIYYFEPTGHELEPGIALNDCTWEEISAIAQLGLGDTFFDIGDTKEITLNGNIGDYFTADNLTLNVFILHFNYAMDGTADNNIVFGCFKNADGIDVGLKDAPPTTTYISYSLPVSGSRCFNYNHTWTSTSSTSGLKTYNYGGWKGCDLRYDILGATSTPPSQYNQLQSSSNVGYDATADTLANPVADTFLAALPADLRGVLRLWTRWVEGVGNNTDYYYNLESTIRATVDAVTYLAGKEVYNHNKQGNAAECNHQTYMDYYAAGNSVKKYQYNTLTSTNSFGLASPRGRNHWCFGHATQSAGYACMNPLLAPAFLV